MRNSQFSTAPRSRLSTTCKTFGKGSAGRKRADQVQPLAPATQGGLLNGPVRPLFQQDTQRCVPADAIRIELVLVVSQPSEEYAGYVDPLRESGQVIVCQ